MKIISSAFCLKVSQNNSAFFFARFAGLETKAQLQQLEPISVSPFRASFLNPVHLTENAQNPLPKNSGSAFGISIIRNVFKTIVL